MSGEKSGSCKEQNCDKPHTRKGKASANYENELMTFRNEILEKIKLFRIARAEWAHSLDQKAARLEVDEATSLDPAIDKKSRKAIIKKLGLKLSQIRSHRRVLRPRPYFTMKRTPPDWDYNHADHIVKKQTYEDKKTASNLIKKIRNKTVFISKKVRKKMGRKKKLRRQWDKGKEKVVYPSDDSGRELQNKQSANALYAHKEYETSHEVDAEKEAPREKHSLIHLDDDYSDKDKDRYNHVWGDKEKTDAEQKSSIKKLIQRVKKKKLLKIGVKRKNPECIPCNCRIKGEMIVLEGVFDLPRSKSLPIREDKAFKNVLKLSEPTFKSDLGLLTSDSVDLIIKKKMDQGSSTQSLSGWVSNESVSSSKSLKKKLSCLEMNGKQPEATISPGAKSSDHAKNGDNATETFVDVAGRSSRVDIKNLRRFKSSRSGGQVWDTDFEPFERKLQREGEDDLSDDISLDRGEVRMVQNFKTDNEWSDMSSRSRFGDGRSSKVLSQRKEPAEGKEQKTILKASKQQRGIVKRGRVRFGGFSSPTASQSSSRIRAIQKVKKH